MARLSFHHSQKFGLSKWLDHSHLRETWGRDVRHKRSKKPPSTLPIRRGSGFFPVLHKMIKSENYKRLTSSEKVVLQYICAGYNGTNGTEADPIICPYESIPVQSVTIAKALKVLSADGWITYVTFGGIMKNANRYAFGPTLRGFY